MTRSRVRSRIAAAFLVVLTGPATVEALEVSVSPPLATWRDPVTVIVSGTVSTSCGPHILSLAAAHPLLQAGGVVSLEVTAEPCDILAPPTSQPFRLAFELPALEPGAYQVRVDASAAGDGVATAPLSVHHPAAAQILVPELARSDEPVDLSVRSYGSCVGTSLVGVTDHVVELDYASGCPILPPGPSLWEDLLGLGILPPGEYEVRLFERGFSVGGLPALARASFRVWDAAGCVPSPTTLCLHEGRFRLEVAWRDFQGGAGPGRPIPLAGRDDSGLFWFFHPENVELTAKVIDACALDGHFWVFVSSGSTVEYELTVTDTAAEESVSYRNELGEVPGLIADTAALATCAP